MISRAQIATPEISVRLFKSISRKVGEQGLPTSMRYQNKEPSIDLTPHLGDGSSVVVDKGIDQPAGTFTITIPDIPQETGEVVGPGSLSPGLESVYGLCEPMDCVEIRMWGGLGVRPDVLPIKMRGFISKVRSEWQMSSDGKPRRVIILSGHDYGKILQTYQILYLSGYEGAEPLLTVYKFFEKFGIEVTNTLTCAQFVSVLLEKAINPLLKNIMPEYNTMPREIKPDMQATGIMSDGFQTQQGSVYDLARVFMDVGHWNEFYVEDREEGVYLVWRPKPFFDLMSGELTQEVQRSPRYATIPDNFIVSLTRERDDQEVYNYFWTTSERWQMVDDDFQRVVAAQNNLQQPTLEYENTAVKYYGIRAFYSDTATGPEAITNMSTGQPEDVQASRLDLMSDWLKARRQVCIDNNKDNVVFEKGEMTIKGGPERHVSSDYGPSNIQAMRPGDYIRVWTGALSWHAYVTHMTDSYQPFRSYTTSLQYERGTGFAERVAKTAGLSPALTEMADRSVPFSTDRRTWNAFVQNNNNAPIMQVKFDDDGRSE
ncbi:hypothetical protein ACVOZ6_004724 [Escherichia coli]